MHSATRYAGVRSSNISSFSSAASGLLWTGVLPALLVPVRGKFLTDCYEMGALGSVFGSMGAFFALIWPVAAVSFVVKTWCVSGYIWCNAWLKWKVCCFAGRLPWFHRPISSEFFEALLLEGYPPPPRGGILHASLLARMS